MLVSGREEKGGGGGRGEGGRIEGEEDVKGRERKRGERI